MLYINFKKFFQILFYEHIHISILSIALILFLLMVVVGYTVRLIRQKTKSFMLSLKKTIILLQQAKS